MPRVSPGAIGRRVVAMEEEDVLIATVVRARGIRGEVVCNLHTDFPERFDGMEQVTVLTPQGTRTTRGLEKHWFQKGQLVLKLEGCDSRDAAEKMAGTRVVISSDELSALEDGLFYEDDLLGMEAVTLDGDRIGAVTGFIKNGGTDVLVIKAENGKELMVPFADEICTEVDLDSRRITVDAPAGLLEL